MSDSYYILTEEEKKLVVSYLKGLACRFGHCFYCTNTNLEYEDALYFRFSYFLHYRYNTANYVCDESCLNLLILSRLHMERE